MATASRRAAVWAGSVFVVWVVLLGSAFWYFVLQPRQWFDPQMVQPPALATPATQAELWAALQDLLPPQEPNRPLLLRMRQQSCRCERFVEPYHQQLAERLQHQMQVITLELDELSPARRTQIARWIPATPSVLVFNNRREATYFGPYHQDGICSADNSFLEPVLDALLNGEELVVFNTLVFGCFCPLPERQTSPY